MTGVSEAASTHGATRESRVLAAAPTSFLVSGTGEPAFGAYQGPLPRVELGDLGLRDRIARRKRWVYGAIVTGEVWLSFAIVRTGYAATVFAFAYDLVAKRMLVDRTVLGPSARVADDVHAQGEIAHFQLGKRQVSLVRSGASLDVRVRLDGIAIDASIDEGSGPPAITAIAPVGAPGEGCLNATEKRVLMGVKGRATCSSRGFVLDGGDAGYDYTHGILPRHTRWRWAFAQGRTTAGEPIAFNVVEGFVGEAECAAFLGGKVIAIAEPAFAFDVADPTKPWRLTGRGIDLRFSPGGVHHQHTNLVVVKSRFVQPVGVFEGTLSLGGREVEVRDLPGVVEDQDVLW